MGHRARATSPRIAALLAITGIAIFTCLGGSASAAKVHVYSHTFGAGELSLSPQSGITVNQETGEVYLADTKHSRVAKFTGAGSADGALATVTTPSFIAVDNSTGPSKDDIYVVGEEFGTVTKLSPLGLPVSGWGSMELGERKGRLNGLAQIAGIAVDPQGDLWVLSREGTIQATMREFDPADAGQEVEAGETVSEFTIHIGGDPRGSNGVPLFNAGVGLHGIAVGSDQLYAFSDFQEKNATLERLTLDGKAYEVPEKGGAYFLSARANGVTIDPSEGDAYVSQASPTSGTVPTDVSPNIERLSPTTPGNEKGLEIFGGAHEGLLPDSTEVVDGLETIGALAIHSSTGDVYAVDPLASDVAVYSLEEVVPPTATMEPPDSITQTSAHVVGHINPNAPLGSLPSHEVVWQFKCVPRCPGYEGHFEADGQEHTVEATLEGLKAGWEYTVSLVAENRGGRVESVKESFPTAPLAPGVKDEFAADVHTGEATLNAAINPNGAATTYHFEYMTKAAFEAEGFGGSQTHSTPESEPIAPLKPDPLHPEDVPAIPRVSARVSGLEPATDYVYRAVATNSIDTTDGEPSFFRSQVAEHPIDPDCPNQTLRTEEGARLPDCRAYELASPTEKGGSLVEPYEAVLQTSPDGSAVTWYSGESASGVPGSGDGGHQDPAFYLSSLAPGSWSTQRLLPPESLGVFGHFAGLSADGRFAMLESSKRSGGSPALSLLDTADRTFSTIVPPQVGQTIEKRAFTLDGSSHDDSLFFFESPLQLTSDAAPGKDNLYLWNRQTEALSLVGVLPGAKAEAPAGGSFGGSYAWLGGKEARLNTGGSQAGFYVGAVHAISNSGDRAYFTAGETGQIYLRSGLTGAKPSTVRVSVANAGVHDSNGQKPAAFLEATPEGGKVFFTSPGKLTADASTGSSDEGNDLYRYDAEAKKLIDVTPLPGGAGARVQGLLGIAADGASGYLAAKGVLAEGGVAGKNNVYHFEEGSGGAFSFKFVAALSGDTGNWSPSAGITGGVSFDVAKTARVSADGETLLFMSSQQLDGGPQGECARSICPEAYRYSIAEEALACVSCNPSTAPGAPVIGAELSTRTAPNLVPESVPIYGTMPRNLSSTGTRVFFESSESLLPEDQNGQNCTDPRRCVDVYEWEAVGTDSCQAAEANGGCLYLLSSGESGESSYFLDASTNGDSAYFITDSQLVPADKDELPDVYNARVDGGLASQHVIPTESCRSAEACAGAGTSPPTPQSAGTQTFQGPGNPPATRCKQGVSRKHAKCVKRKAKKHHKKKSRAIGKKRLGGAK